MLVVLMFNFSCSQLSMGVLQLTPLICTYSPFDDKMAHTIKKFHFLKIVRVGCNDRIALHRIRTYKHRRSVVMTAATH